MPASLRVPESSRPPLARWQRALAAILVAVAALVVALADVRAARGSDPFGTLLVSTALVEHGTIRLDALGIAHLDQRLGYRWFERDGHQYYVYPLGPSLLAAPLVGLARLAGVDVTVPDTEVQVQHWLVVLCTALTVVVLLQLARRLLPFGAALACAAAFWAGTSLASVTGAALWSHTPAVLLALIAIDMVVADELAQRTSRWGLIGLVLFAAWLCRPTMAVFAVAVLGWVALRDWRRALAAAAVVGSLLAAFAAFSWHEFGQLLPPYYTMGTSGGEFTTTGLAGLLVSPSRGLLVFSPVLLGAWITRPLARRDWPLGAGWLLVAVGWPVVLVAALSRWEMWWGGGCFGPRLLTDALPGLFLLTARVWPVRWPDGLSGWLRVGVLATAALFSSWVHVAQGLYNPWVQHWNVEPAIDTDPWTRFDWRFPQFLHSGDRHRARLVAYFERHPPDRGLARIEPGVVLAADAPAFDAVGFDRMRDEGRWTLLQVAELRFAVAHGTPPFSSLSVTFGTNGRQRVRIVLNDTELADRVFDTTTTTVTMAVPPGSVHDGLNRLRFVTPDARRRGRGDARQYGVVVKTIRFDQ